MDIIEIDSSDSEDDFGIGSLSSEEFFVDDGVDQLESNSQRHVENNDPPPMFPTRSSNYNDYRASAPRYAVDSASSTATSGASLGDSATKTVMDGPRLGAYETVVDFGRANFIPHSFKNNLSPSRMSKGSEVSSLTNPESEAISAKSGMGLNSSTLLNQGTPFSIQKDVTKPAYERDLHEEMYIDAPKRVLPPSMFSFKDKTLAKDFSVLKDEKKNGVYGPSSFPGENEFHDLTRIRAPQFADERLSTLPRTSRESRDDLHGSATTSRMLPSSFVLGKPIHTLTSPSISDGERHLGIGGDRLLERDERHIYQEALQNLGQPRLEDDLPEGLLAVPLLKHQKIALAWMAQKEKSVHCSGGILADDQGLGKTISMIALIQKQMPQQSKFTSHDSNCAKPEALNLDEDEDVVEVDKTKPLSVENDQKRGQVAGLVMHTSHNSRPAAGTLVVCPASVLRQWARELDEKVPDCARLSVLVYHGGTRTKDPNELAKYHVVLTTYSIVTNEVPKQPIADDDEGEQKNLDKYGLIPEFAPNKKRKQISSGQNNTKKKRKNLKGFIDFGSGPLARVRWFRVILDEAQTIKNHRTQVARACCGLRAKRRWCLSGTPMQNAIDDLYSYFRFLKYDPYSVYSSFCASIKYPISKNANNGYRKLQAVLKTVLLRRTKDSFIDGEPILKLPPKSICLKKVDFSQEERDFYLKLEADSRQQFKEFAATGTLRQNYASILMLLLRLRQACGHPLLVKGFHTDTIGKFSVDMARQLPREMLVNLLNQLEEGSLPICAVCSDPPEDAVVSMCGHVFCFQCVSECLTGDDNTCPAPRCKNVLDSDSVFSRSTLRSCISDNFDDEGSTSTAFEGHLITHSGYISSKIKAALDILKPIACPSSRTINNLMICGPDSNDNTTNHTSTYFNSNSKVPEKAIVFSQWTSMLDLLELSLNDSLIQYRRLDGSMSLMLRDQAVKDFNTDPEVTVMLMSLKAGSLGLNMVAACHVILLDLWWNPTTEDQAVDRAHRIGQTRPVTVSRITVKDTVEDRILALQEEKRKMVSSAFGEDQAGSHATKLTVDDLRYLFNCFDD